MVSVFGCRDGRVDEAVFVFRLFLGVFLLLVSIHFAVVKYKSCRGTDVFISIPGIQMQQKPPRKSTLTAIAPSLPHPTQLKWKATKRRRSLHLIILLVIRGAKAVFFSFSFHGNKLLFSLHEKVQPFVSDVGSLSISLSLKAPLENK